LDWPVAASHAASPRTLARSRGALDRRAPCAPRACWQARRSRARPWHWAGPSPTAAPCLAGLGFVGAGFVVGIRIIAEWFPAKETGYAQGHYAGLGNFGSAAAAVALPSLALLFGGDDGWRWAIAATGAVALVYSVVYYLTVSDTPKGSTYFSPKKMGSMEVTSRGDFILYCLMQAPLVLALAALAWKLGPSGLKLISASTTWAIYLALAGLYATQLLDTWRINWGVFAKATPEVYRYRFSQVAVLDVTYLITFGSELAVVSILPLLFKDTFGLSLTVAGFLGASFGMTTFFARPAGGWLSDRLGRRRILVWCLTGTAAGYAAMSLIGPATGAAFAVAATFLCSLFVNAGNGAVYAIPVWVDAALEKAVAKLPSERTDALSALVEDLRRPNLALGYDRPRPLIERDPVRFWQGLALVQLVILLAVIVWLGR
jgi:NNP family nitrate/nitrite transporter-like MFS transporter